MQTKLNVKFIATSAVIAAAYVALSFVSAAFGLAFGPVQLRLSEVLCVLPVFTPAAIPGLFVGCIISNLLSFSPLDILFGSLATLIAAVLTRAFRNIRFKDIPLLSLFPPVIVKAVIVGTEIAVFFMPHAAFLRAFLINAVQVFLGQMIVCYVFGIPFYFAMKRVRF